MIRTVMKAYKVNHLLPIHMDVFLANSFSIFNVQFSGLEERRK